jgi:hypothetical protein
MGIIWVGTEGQTLRDKRDEAQKIYRQGNAFPHTIPDFSILHDLKEVWVVRPSAFDTAKGFDFGRASLRSFQMMFIIAAVPIVLTLE